MSYDYHDAAMDEAYERLSEELYPSHKAQAIVEFTRERLRSYYLEHSDLLLPAGRTYKLAKALLAANQSALNNAEARTSACSAGDCRWRELQD